MPSGNVTEAPVDTPPAVALPEKASAPSAVAPTVVLTENVHSLLVAFAVT